MKLSSFKKGMRVKYIPTHAKNDRDHPDCNGGVVSSVNDKFVFVKYDFLDERMVTGDEPYTAQATNPSELVPENTYRKCQCGAIMFTLSDSVQCWICGTWLFRV